MPLLTLKFTPEEGPVLSIGLRRPTTTTNPHKYQTAEEPKIRSVRMLVDTGASWSCINPRLADEIGLIVIGKIPMRSVTHKVASNLYMADIVWKMGGPVPILFSDIRLMEFPMADDKIDGLLGRDLLCKGLLHMNGIDQTVTLAY